MNVIDMLLAARKKQNKKRAGCLLWDGPAVAERLWYNLDTCEANSICQLCSFEQPEVSTGTGRSAPLESSPSRFGTKQLFYLLGRPHNGSCVSVEKKKKKRGTETSVNT
ncbi:uncharacterized protein LOC144009777 [Festucalex cinctus]